MVANKLGLPRTTRITHFLDRHFMFVFDVLSGRLKVRLGALSMCKQSRSIHFAGYRHCFCLLQSGVVYFSKGFSLQSTVYVMGFILYPIYIFKRYLDKDL